jgi:DHA1 family tetracycline resistance protein-like MFS transporter
MTHRVSEREQGALQGAIGSLRSLGFLIGPGLFSWTYAWFINPVRSVHLPGAPYFPGAALLFAAMLMSTRIEKADSRTAATTPDIPETIPPDGVA